MRDCTSMGESRTHTDLSGPTQENYHWLILTLGLHLTRHLLQRCRVDILNVRSNDLCLRIICQILNVLRQLDIGGVANAQKGVKAQTIELGLREEIHAQIAALRDQTDGTQRQRKDHPPPIQL